MKALRLTPFQAEALAAIKPAAERRGWKGEAAVVDDMLIYQVPLPRDPDVSGAVFAVDPDEANIMLYLLLPSAVPKPALQEACELVTRFGGGMRFGALELDLDHGTLRIRMDCDATEDDIGNTVERLIERAGRAAHSLSEKWRSFCHDAQSAEAVVRDSLVQRKETDD